MTVVDNGTAFTISVGLVSASFFPILGLPAAEPWTAPTVDETPVVLAKVVAAGMGGQVVGRRLTTVTGRNLRVVGILPANFVFPQEPRRAAVTALMPLGDERIVQLRSVGRGFAGQTLTLLARVRPEVPVQALDAAVNGMADTAGAAARNWTVRPLTSVVVGELRPLAVGAVILASLILLIAAANLGGLFLTRWTYRAADCAMRSALGARAADLVRLLLCDAAWLSCFGMIASLAVAGATLSVTAVVIPPQYAAFGVPRLDSRTAGCAAALTVVVVVLALIPVMIVGRRAGRVAWGGVPTNTLRPSTGMRFWLTAIQSAISGVLVVGAVLLARSYMNLLMQDTGFGSNAMEVSAVYPSEEAAASVLDAVQNTVARLSALPGVRHAGATQGPLANERRSIGSGIIMNGQWLAAQQSGVTGDYFSAAGIRMVSGRAPRPGERGVAVINRSLEGLCCAGHAAVGKVFTRGSIQLDVIGVADDSFDMSLDTPPVPRSYEPMRIPDLSAGGIRINYVLDAGAQGASILRQASQVVWSVHRTAQVLSVGSVNSRLWATVRNRTFATLVVALFALASLGISVAGIMGVVGFTVARRTHEIGVIVALGATPTDVRLAVTRDAAMAVTIGLLIGIATGAWASKALASLLYGIVPADPVSVGIAAVSMVSVITVAALASAQRAVSLSPATALREP
jgi:putative ABC transport system permease protein